MSRSATFASYQNQSKIALADETDIYDAAFKPAKHLWKPILASNKAHVTMLAEQDIVEPSEARAVLRALAEIEQMDESDVEWSSTLRKPVAQVEALVVEKVGYELGRMLLTGRSAGDIQRVAERMDLRSILLEMMSEVNDVRRAVIKFALSNKAVLMPGYAKLQHAQPMTFGFYLLSFTEALSVCFERLQGAYRRLNQSPAEVGVGMTTSFPVDRYRVAELLGFDGLVENAFLAHRDRSSSLEVVQVLSLLALDIYRLCEDVIIWCAGDINYMELDDRHRGTSGTGFMAAEKTRKTPDAIYLAQIGAIESHAASVMLYEIAMSNTSEFVMASVRGLNASHEAALAVLVSIRLVNEVLPRIQLHTEVIEESLESNFSQATDLADLLVREGRLSFGEAHKVAGTVIQHARDASIQPLNISADMIREAGDRALQKSVTVSESAVKAALDPRKSVESKSVIGGPAKDQIEGAATRQMSGLEKNDSVWLEEAAAKVAHAERLLSECCSSITNGA